MTDDKAKMANTKTEWTARELANEAGVSGARIRQLLIEGKELRGRKVGYMWVISDQEARRWLASRQT